MPELIYSPPFAVAHDAIERTDAAEALDAAMWELLRATQLSRYPLLKATARGPVHYLQIDPTPHRSGVIVVFTPEKPDEWLLIDVTIVHPDP